MQLSTIRLIAGKEFRDLLRDRRTVLLILVLPIILYPLFGLMGYVFALSLMGKDTNVGIVGAAELPQAAGPWPMLLQGEGFAEGLDTSEAGIGRMVVKNLTVPPEEALRAKTVDAVVTVGPGFLEALTRKTGDRPTIRIEHREGDEKAKLAGKRTAEILDRWQDRLREVRFANAGLPKDFHKVVAVVDSLADKPKEKRAADELRDVFSRAFPFVLMMWLVAGTIQPAVDMTAGEKERGTMETLLISPASRPEIVLGKFFAVALFAFGSVVWNVIWVAGAVLIMEAVLAFPILNLFGVVGCLILGVTQAMFFSAVCLSLGVFAKSTKEGQYYLMPLILIVMPLAFYAMMPGAELSPSTCWIPVTGTMLLQSRLLSVSAEPLPWVYFPIVFGASSLWVALALWTAVRQFSRESVLFRETGTTKPSLRNWFRRKQA